MPWGVVPLLAVKVTAVPVEGLEMAAVVVDRHCTVTDAPGCPDSTTCTKSPADVDAPATTRTTSCAARAVPAATGNAPAPRVAEAPARIWMARGTAST